MVVPLAYMRNSLNVGTTASPTQIISSTRAITAPSVSVTSFYINNLASINSTGKFSGAPLALSTPNTTFTYAAINGLYYNYLYSTTVNSITITSASYLQANTTGTAITYNTHSVQVNSSGTTITGSYGSAVIDSGNINALSLTTTGTGLSVYNGASKTASISQAGAISASSISTTGILLQVVL